MDFSGEFQVPASPDTVMLAFADVPRMASMMPGATIDGQEEDGSWRGGMLVAFGPKRIQFRGKVKLDLDPATHSGSMLGRGAADVRSSRVEMRVGFQVKPLPDADGKPQSQVTLDSQTVLGGVLAEFGKAGGQVVARALMEEFALRLREDLSRQAPDAAALEDSAVQASQSAHLVPAQASAAAPASAAPQPAAPLRAERLLWAIVRQWFARLFGRG